MSKFVKRLNKEVDKSFRKLDTNTSKAIGMSESNKISHAANVDSPHHKASVHELKNIIDDKDEQVPSIGQIAKPTEENN